MILSGHGHFNLWILSKLNNLNVNVDKAFAEYNFAETITSIERFIWHDFCDEYIEAVKYRLYNDEISDESRKAAKYTLRCVIETSLKLLAPIVPFFTEEVYQYFGEGSALESTSELDIDGLVVSEDLLNIKKDIVGASGKKVDIIQSEELDVILEVMR